jgi:hypothetical protein
LPGLVQTEYRYFLSQLERVSLPVGQLVYEAQGSINHDFPETAVFSMLATREDGRTIEVGPVGKEGLVSYST